MHAYLGMIVCLIFCNSSHTHFSSYSTGYGKSRFLPICSYIILSNLVAWICKKRFLQTIDYQCKLVCELLHFFWFLGRIGGKKCISITRYRIESSYHEKNLFTQISVHSQLIILSIFTWMSNSLWDAREFERLSYHQNYWVWSNLPDICYHEYTFGNKVE